jgi:hypothetical protein
LASSGGMFFTEPLRPLAGDGLIALAVALPTT